MRKLTHQELLARQRETLQNRRMPFCVVLNNIRSLYNVGSIFRSSDGAGVGKIWLCGITGHPPNKQIAKTALGAQNSVPWEYRDDAVELIRELKTEGYSAVLLEQTEKSCLYQNFKPEGPVCLVIGHEVEGVSDELVSLADAAIEIEMAGLKNSLNVAVAFGIAAYHLRRSYKQANPNG